MSLAPTKDKAAKRSSNNTWCFSNSDLIIVFMYRGRTVGVTTRTLTYFASVQLSSARSLKHETKRRTGRQSECTESSQHGTFHDFRKSLAFALLERRRRLRNLHLEPNSDEFNLRSASSPQVLTMVAPDLRDVVVFGSVCTVYRDQRKIRSRGEHT